MLSAMVWHRAGSEGWEEPIISAAKRFRPPRANNLQGAFELIPFALITFAIGGFALWERRPKLAFSGVGGCLAATIAAEQIFKPLVARRQLFHLMPWHPNQQSRFETFPSGHVAAAAACAMFAWLVFSRRTPFAVLAFLVPVTVAWSTIALGAHYPADALAGFLLGPLVVSAAVFGTYRVFGRDDNARDARPSGRDRRGSS